MRVGLKLVRHTRHSERSEKDCFTVKEILCNSVLRTSNISLLHCYVGNEFGFIREFIRFQGMHRGETLESAFIP